jgi:hypothetical protein
MKDKLGPYVSKLMATIVDKESDEFVKDLAITELTRLNINIQEFLLKHNDETEERKQTEKQLLQENK